MLQPRPRWKLLGHPLAVASTALLLLNDDALKAVYPGTVTGKLSDFAGVGMVGVATVALLGRAPGVLFTAVAFAALKLSGSVGEAAAPFLGGYTRQDSTDLIALVMLVPVAWAGRPNADADADADADIVTARSTARPWLTATPALAAINALLAVTATTATACGPRPAVVQVSADGDTFYAAVNYDEGMPVWAQSTDLGRSWQRSEGPRRPPPNTAPYELHSEIPPQGPTTACSGTECWDVVGERRIVHRRVGGPGTTVFELTSEQFTAITTGCFGGHQGILGSVAAVETQDTTVVVASLGADGVLVRSTGGNWTATRVLAAPPRPATRVQRWLAMSPVVVLPVLMLSLVALGRRRLPSLPLGVAAAASGGIAVLVVEGLVSVMTPASTDPQRITAWIGTIGTIATAVTAVVVARHRPSRSPTTSVPWPWPPPSSP